MTRDEIIHMAVMNGFYKNDEGIVTSPFIEDVDISELLLDFAEDLVAKARQEMREEIVYSWVPPHFVDIAIESCAERAWIALVKHKQPWNVRQDVTEAILKKDEE